MKEYTNEALLALAKKARENAHCPYSGIAVGAALLTKSGEVFLGANMENASFSPTLCAERVAFGSALAAGHREFARIAVVGGKKENAPEGAFPPCVVCRQVMAAFCGGEFEVILDGDGGCRVLTLAELLPNGFDKNYL